MRVVGLILTLAGATILVGAASWPSPLTGGMLLTLGLIWITVSTGKRRFRPGGISTDMSRHASDYHKRCQPRRISVPFRSFPRSGSRPAVYGG